MDNIPVFDFKSTASVNSDHATEYDFPLMEQKAPFDAKVLFGEFCRDTEKAVQLCRDKRFEATGIASKIGPDIHGKPSIEVSDCVGGHCHVLFVFESAEEYEGVSVGDVVTCRGNYLGVTSEFGVVLKRCEII